MSEMEMRGEQHDWPRLMLRLPPDAKAWVAAQAELNGSSQNSEIVRSLRERMERAQTATGDKLPGTTPAAATHSPACQGGSAING